MAANISLWFLAAYIAVFVVFAYRAGEFQWLWGSVLLWLGFGAIGARLLPGLWGITHLSALYMPHFYIALASLFFLVPRWQKMPEKHRWQLSGGQAFLSLFALSGMLMSVVFALLLAMVWYRFPTGITPYVLPALLQMYLFEPVYWVCMQSVLMPLFYLHRVVIEKQPANCFSRRQLQLGFLLALFFQMAFVVGSLLRIRY